MGFNSSLLVMIEMNNQICYCESFVKRNKCFLFYSFRVLRKHKRQIICLCEITKWCKNLWIIRNNSLIKVYKSEKDLYIFYTSSYLQVENSVIFVAIYFMTRCTNNPVQIFDLINRKVIFTNIYKQFSSTSL